MARQLENAARLEMALKEADDYLQVRVCGVAARAGRALEPALTLSQAAGAASAASCEQKEALLQSIQLQLHELQHLNHLAEAAVEKAETAKAEAEARAAAASKAQGEAQGKLSFITQQAAKDKAEFEARIQSYNADWGNSMKWAKQKSEADGTIRMLQEQLLLANSTIEKLQRDLDAALAAVPNAPDSSSRPSSQGRSSADGAEADIDALPCRRR
jgi:hypothetical protein